MRHRAYLRHQAPALRGGFNQRPLACSLTTGENMAGRFNDALGVGAAGFSQGMVCAVPVGVS
jgi:hypothetical protein